MSEFAEPVAKGYLNKVEDRESEKHPAYKGSLVIAEDMPAGTKLWLAGWPNKGDDGNVYVSIRANKAEKAAATRKPTKPSRAVLEDEIPF